MESYKFPRAEARKRSARFSNLVVYEIKDKLEYVAEIPGLSFTDITRGGVSSLFSIARMLEKGTTIIPTSSIKFVVQDDSTELVVLGQNVDITPYWHQRVKIRFPMKLRSYVSRVGNSSYCVELLLTDAGTGLELLSAQRILAFMNPKTSRSIKIPADVKHELEVLLHRGENKKVEILQDFPSKPSTSFDYSLTVRHSDTDMLYHSNQASYFKYFMDAATEGTKRGYFKLFKGDLLSYSVKSMKCLYKGESHAGDELKCCVWQNDNNETELYCQIEKEDRIIWIGSVGFILPLAKL